MGQVSVWFPVLGLNQVLSFFLPLLYLPLLSGASPHWEALFFMMNMELPLRNKPLNDNSYGIELIRFGGQYVMSDRPTTTFLFSFARSLCSPRVEGDTYILEERALIHPTLLLYACVWITWIT
jgi:hypothetical protein